MIMEVVIDGLVVYVAIAGIAGDMLGVPRAQRSPRPLRIVVNQEQS